MRIVVAAVGRMKDGPERELAARYLERAEQAGRAISLGPFDIREIPESRSRRPEDRKRDEAQAILALLDSSSPLIVLDERGKSPSSTEFSARIGRWRDEGASALQFAIGGADGLDETVRARAAMVLSFGGLTMPHQLVRVLLAEQLYRTTTILSGHPYHRE
ncbi:23S rRNA (pseudouridine(1915)-N(3))-methyltransferase RlmH [Flaviflagellibacter deserti]|uniref:Ribosomal RNA large subunit methyltransferase H n=1 Tax=Flaviflagellibacter deserti TaxID=2267266 RepID=A0ABV9Z7W2_9HYPH